MWVFFYIGCLHSSVVEVTPEFEIHRSDNKQKN